MKETLEQRAAEVASRMRGSTVSFASTEAVEELAEVVCDLAKYVRQGAQGTTRTNTKLPRYLYYNIDKHQSTPWFKDTLNHRGDIAAGLTAVIDLHTGLVWCGSEGYDVTTDETPSEELQPEWREIEKR